MEKCENDLDGEIWKDIDGYDGKYQVSDMGRVRNAVEGNLLKIRLNGKSTTVVDIRYGNKQKQYVVKKLVLKYFMDNHQDDNKLIIIHKDGNIFNNKLENLKQVTEKEILDIKINKFKNKNIEIIDDEIWKDIDGYDGKYQVSDQGRVRNATDGKLFGCKKFNKYGFVVIGLFKNGRSDKYQLHRLVAKYFLPNHDKKELLMHIDGNKLNNKVENLKWVSKFEVKDKYGSKEKIITLHIIEDLEGEIWKGIDGFDGIFQISNMGRVKNIKNNKLINHYKSPKLEPVAILRTNGEKRHYRLKQLVAEYFVPNQENKEYVMNIDGNLENNKADNLKWVDKYDLKINLNLDKTIDNDEIWKNIKEFPSYQISNYGNVRHKYKLNSLKKVLVGGYYTVGLRDSNLKPVTLQIHRIVANHFIENPNNYKQIDHIDNNKLNNHINNLRWATQSQNINSYNQNFNKFKYMRKINQYDLEGNLIKEWLNVKEIVKENPTFDADIIRASCRNNYFTFNYKWKYAEDYENKYELNKDEIFKNCGILENHDYSNYEVSNYGKVRNIKTNKFMKLSENLNGYYSLILYDVNSKPNRILVHRIVAMVFVKGRTDNKNVVNHLDENKLNNYYKNLEWTTSLGNNTHSFAKKVVMIDKHTNETLKTFNSIKEACDYLNKRVNIVDCCKGRRKSSGGYKWKYLEE